MCQFWPGKIAVAFLTCQGNAFVLFLLSFFYLPLPSWQGHHFQMYIPCLLFLFGTLVICSTSVSDIVPVSSTHYCVSKILHHLLKKIFASAI